MIGEPGLHLHHDERPGGELELAGEREPAVWTQPRTWVAGEVLTASLLNTHLRDQLLYLGETDSRASAPPGAPRDGQLWRYVADATNGVEWLLAYNASDGSTSKWHRIGGPPIFSEVQGSGTITGAAYAATPNGPDITLARAGDYVVSIGFRAASISAGDGPLSMSYAIGGTAASDADFVQTPINLANISVARTRSKASIAAATTLAANYKKVGGGVNPTIDSRWMTAQPTRIA